MKRIKALCVLVCLLLLGGTMLVMLTGGADYASADPVSYSSAKAMCTMEAGSGRVLFSKNMNERLAMASTTKIMTAITAIENCSDLDEKFVISPKAVGISGTSLYLRKGEAFSVRELLYGLMLISGNDASVAIGERVGGNVKNFVALMNKTAQKIGAKNTLFANTHGLDEKGHYTTAFDLALITSYALKNDTFKEIVSTKNTKIYNTDGKGRYLKNKNKLLHLLEGCNGVKTGFTDDAGRCLVSSCERNGMQLVCVVLNCGPMFEESAQLLESGFAQYRLYDLTECYDYPKYLKLTNSRKDFVKVGTRGNCLYPLKEGEINRVKYIYTLPQTIEAPIGKDKEIGKVEVYFGKNLIFSEKIYTMEEVRGNTIWERIKNVLTEW